MSQISPLIFFSSEEELFSWTYLLKKTLRRTKILISPVWNKVLKVWDDAAKISSKFFYNKNPANIYWFNVNNWNTRKRCETCSKSTIKSHYCRSGIFIVNFEHISHLFSSAFIVYFEQVNDSWETGALGNSKGKEPQKSRPKLKHMYIIYLLRMFALLE